MKGIIYAIIDNETNDRYIGSTCNLEKRIAGHKSKNNNCASKKIIERGNYRVEVLLNIQFAEDEDETHKNLYLRIKEDFFIKNAEKVINKKSAYVSKEDKKKKLNEWKKTKHKCVCGGFYTNNHFAKHRKTDKHASFEKINNLIEKMNGIIEELEDLCKEPECHQAEENI